MNIGLNFFSVLRLSRAHVQVFKQLRIMRRGFKLKWNYLLPDNHAPECFQEYNYSNACRKIKSQAVISASRIGLKWKWNHIWEYCHSIHTFREIHLNSSLDMCVAPKNTQIDSYTDRHPQIWSQIYSPLYKACKTIGIFLNLETFFFARKNEHNASDILR